MIKYQYINKTYKYSVRYNDVQKVDTTLRAVFDHTNKDGIETFDFNEIPVCTEQDCGSEICPIEYLPTPEQQKHLLEYCLVDTNTKYSSWFPVFTLNTSSEILIPYMS